MKNIIFASLALLLIQMENAHSYYYGGIDTDVLYSIEDSNSEGNAKGYRVGPTLAYGYDRYYTSFKFRLGSETFSSNSNAAQGSTDVELNAGYRVTPLLSAFVGYRYRSLDFTRSIESQLDATETFSHFGLGAAISYPLAKDWLLKSDIYTYYLTNNYESDSMKNSGSGYSGGTSVGILKRWNDGYKANLSYKLQYTNAGYFTGGSFNSISTGLSVGVGKVF